MYSTDKIIQDWCNECGTVCMTQNDYTEKIINIYTNRPGYMIGYKGQLVDKYRALINSIGWNIKIFEINEIHYPGDNWEDIIDERVKGYFEME